MLLGIGINSGAFACQHDVAHIDIFLHVGIYRADNAVFHLLIAEIRLGKLSSVAVELVFESLRIVDSLRFSISHLLFIGDKHVEIFVDSLRCELLTVVFVIEIFKFAKGHSLAIDSHQLRIFRAFGLNHGNRCQDQGQ